MIKYTFTFLGGMIAGTYSLLAYDESSFVRLIMGFILGFAMIMCGRVFSDAVQTLREVYGSKHLRPTRTIRYTIREHR